jgi:hypothetical protein
MNRFVNEDLPLVVGTYFYPMIKCDGLFTWRVGSKELLKKDMGCIMAPCDCEAGSASSEHLVNVGIC